MKRLTILFNILLFATTAFAGDTQRWRAQHERAIVAEFAELLAIPNLASDAPNINKNAAAIQALLESAASRRASSRSMVRRRSSSEFLTQATVTGGQRSLSTRTTTGSRWTRPSGRALRGRR
jgi:hypothetical protein